MFTETLNTTYGLTSAALLPLAEASNLYGLSTHTMKESVGDSTSLDPLLPLVSKIHSSNASYQVGDGGSTLTLSNAVNTASPLKNSFFRGDYNDNLMAKPTLGTFNMNVNTVDPGSNLTASSPITINPSLLSNYTMGGISTNEVNVSQDGTLKLSGDLWTKLDFPYNVTQNTVLEFEFRSDAMGYAHVIGFDNDNSYWDNSNSNKTGFKLYGTETWSGWNQALNNYSGTNWKSYSFKIGDLFTGAMNYLFFVNTNTNGTSGNSFFRNIRVYDKNFSAPTKALWYSGFENGFPGGEWLNYDTGSYSSNGQSTQSSNWTILNQTQANQEGVMKLSGNSVYKGWINTESTNSHRPYPLIHVDPSSQWNPDTTFNDYLSSPAVPVVNRFYVYMDWDSSKISDSDWLSFMTVTNNTHWGVVGFSLRGANGQLEMAHAPWQTVTSTPAIMPSDRWVRFTTYMDFQTNLLYVWMDGTLIFKMTQGGNLNYTDGSNGQTGHLRRAHWGLYANGGFSDATVYNDSIQLWTVQSPITDPSQEPWSPYDGDGVDFVYSSDSVAPTVSNLNVSTITTSSQDYSFTVSYTDNILMYGANLDSKDIRVTGPNGFNQLAQFVSSTTSADGKTVVGTYKISSNLGWGINNKNGVYTISLEGNQVGDYNYNFMAAQTLGSFNVNVNVQSPITINPSLLSNYTMGGTSTNEINVSQDGTLKLSGDLWTKLDFSYNVTQYTVLEFEFRSDAMGYAHVIGFDNDNSYWNNANSFKLTGFKLYGTETWDRWNQALNNYSGTNWKSYSFKIGDLFTGAMSYLFFVNTNVYGTSGNSFFRNIRVYDMNSLDIAAPTAGLSVANSTAVNGTTFVNANSQYQFTVAYSDASRVNLATLDNNDIKVLAPNGTLQNATLVKTTSSRDRKTVTATYKINDIKVLAPNRTLQNATLMKTTSSSNRKTVTATYKIFDNVGLRANQSNEFLIQLQGNQVSDLNYNFMTARTIGRFTLV